jgi:hypothetical protein
METQPREAVHLRIQKVCADNKNNLSRAISREDVSHCMSAHTILSSIMFVLSLFSYRAASLRRYVLHILSPMAVEKRPHRACDNNVYSK